MSFEHHPVSGQSKRLWQQRAFLLLWSASTAGYFAGWVLKLALPLVAVRLTTSPLLISGITFAFTLPWLLCGLPTGVLTDRLDRRAILLVAAILRLSITGALALASLAQAVSLPLLYGAAFLLGITETLTEPATAALTPALVPLDQLEQANTPLLGAQQFIEVIALPVSGALAALGLVLAVGLSGLAYLVALLALLLLRGAFRPKRPAAQHLIADLLEGMRFLWQHPTLRAISSMAAVINAAWSAWMGVLVLYALAPGPMHLSSFQYGLMLTGSGLGGMAGTLLVGPVEHWLGRRWLIGLNILGNALMFAAPLLTANAWLMGSAIFFGGIGGPMWGVAALSLQQRAVPAHLQGRVFAAYRFISLGAEALGPAIGGLMAQSSGIRAVFLGCTLITVLMLWPFFQHLRGPALAPADPLHTANP